ncbi:TIGR04211 family SH3 domain-containing protein [Methylococcus capsulatus]|jgi:SH3 domain protein|uniref:SH3 domain protein n=1 Tax=Methylococcus capsulatus TaxID=414 RepID=A0AA35V1L2_METCP|nr:TIGR04211 family SH3 domain-containing protein [Methylococcus capsulatus]QXP91343.1 TIGR04211 family SH3 domain-containing protein [Methylococcus capsulatus]CAI8852374.1 SH3 domain protein [Methylococcus capsulatus]
MKRTLACYLLAAASAASAAPEHGRVPADAAPPPAQVSKPRGGQVVLLKDFNEVKQKNLELKQKLAELENARKSLEAELAGLRAGREAAESNSRSLGAENERLMAELAAIRQTSANALQIEAERNRLRETLATVERDLEAKRLENQALAEDSRQRWFLIGAGVLAGGFLLGLIAPQLGWRRRSSWDSF